MKKYKYKKIYEKEIIEHMRSGYSIESFCAVIDVTKPTLYRWAKEIPEFREALELAQAYSAAFWENKLIALADNGHFGAIKLALEKLHKPRWGDQKEKPQMIESNEAIYEIDTGLDDIEVKKDE